jgi:hypothetical protein
VIPDQEQTAKSRREQRENWRWIGFAGLLLIIIIHLH